MIDVTQLIGDKSGFKSLTMVGVVIALGACLSCTMVKVSEDQWAFVPGKGCVYTEGDLMIAESDGISVNLASMIKGLGNLVGSVFGASQSANEGELVESGNGCRVVGTIYSVDE